MGIVAGLLGCLFGVLGILTLGIIFVPLAALCAAIGCAGSGCLNSFPRKISVVPPGFVRRGRRVLGVTQGGRSPTVVASNTRRRKIQAAARMGVGSK
jgi:hypothetical protein